MTVGQKIDALIESAKSIVIMSHSSPDADALCSCITLQNLIKKRFNKRRVDIAIVGKPSESLKPLVKKTKLVPTWFKYDLAICLDCPTFKRLGRYEKLFKSAKNKINIDHHDTNLEFADVNKVDVEASSTCEIIYKMYKSHEIELTPRMQKLIYAGIVTDTACFAANNISQSTHKIVAEIVKSGINVDEIKNYFFKNNSKSKTNLLVKALHSLKFYHNDEIALMKITINDLKKTETKFEDTVGLVDNAVNISCVDIAIAIIEKKAKTYYISLRSKNSDVAEVARIMGGGGHTNMAAFQHTGELRSMQQKLIKECEKVCVAGKPFDKLFD